MTISPPPSPSGNLTHAIAAGVTCGLLAIVQSIGLGSLLATGVPSFSITAIGMALFSSAVVAAITPLLSSSPGIVAITQGVATVGILGMLTSVEAATAGAPPATLIATLGRDRSHRHAAHRRDGVAPRRLPSRPLHPIHAVSGPRRISRRLWIADPARRPRCNRRPTHTAGGQRLRRLARRQVCRRRGLHLRRPAARPRRDLAPVAASDGRRGPGRVQRGGVDRRLLRRCAGRAGLAADAAAKRRRVAADHAIRVRPYRLERHPAGSGVPARRGGAHGCRAVDERHVHRT